MKIKQLSIFIQNKVGSLSEPLEVLSENDINIRAMCMADVSEFSILRLVVNDPDKGKRVLEKNNFLVKITDIVGVEMDDTPGGLTSILKTLKKENINIEYLYAFTHDKSDKAILLLHTEDIDELIDVLKENKFILTPADEVYTL